MYVIDFKYERDIAALTLSSNCYRDVLKIRNMQAGVISLKVDPTNLFPVRDILKEY